MPSAYYNEFDPFAAAWLRELIKMGLIAPGDVDERSITDVQPSDLAGYTQCHFFAGIGGWSYALRLAGWADSRPIWTGSCPCQPFSAAGKGGGVDDPRHLWPDFFRLISACRPPLVVGEQVAGQAGYGWFDGVRADLAREDYAGRCVDIPACAVDAPHIRQRLYWLASAPGVGQADTGYEPGRSGPGEPNDGPVGADGHGPGPLALAGGVGPRGRPCAAGGDIGDRDHPVGQEGAGGASERDGAGVAQGHACGPGLAVGSVEDDRGGTVRDQGAAAGPSDDGDRGDGSGDLGHTARGGRPGAWEPEASGRPPGQREHRGPDGRDGGHVADADVAVLQREPSAGELPVDEQDARAGLRPGSRNGTFWSYAEWIACHDDKARRTEPGSSLLAHGLFEALAARRRQCRDQAQEAVLTYAENSGLCVAETLRLVCDHYGAQEVQLKFGVPRELPAKEVLLDFLRDLAPTRPAGGEQGGEPEAGATLSQTDVRGVHHDGEPVDPPRQRPSNGQPADQPTDALLELSLVLARCAEESRASADPADAPAVSLLAHGVKSRVAKWRGFGNAIVPQEAAEVIGAWLDVENDILEGLF